MLPAAGSCLRALLLPYSPNIKPAPATPSQSSTLKLTLDTPNSTQIIAAGHLGQGTRYLPYSSNPQCLSRLLILHPHTPSLPLTCLAQMLLPSGCCFSSADWAGKYARASLCRFAGCGGQRIVAMHGRSRTIQELFRSYCARPEGLLTGLALLA